MTKRVRKILTVVIALAVMGLASCDHYNCNSGATFGSSTCASGTGGLGGGGGTFSPAVFEYFDDPFGNLVGASLDTSGNFGLIPNFVSPPQTQGGAVGGSVIVQKQWFYLSGGLKIEAYSINGTTGALTAISGSPFSSPDTDAITSDPAGKFLFLCGQNNDQVTVFAINQTNGSLTQVGSFPAGVGFAVQPSTDGLGKFLYVTAGNLGSQVAVFAIGSTGSLTPLAGNPFPISIAQFAGEPTGKFLLGITGNGANNGSTSDDHVYVFFIDQSTGAITPVTGSPFATTFTPATLAVHPNGTLVYTFNQTVTGLSPIEGFQFNTTTGALSPVASSPFTALAAQAGRFDQSGAYLSLHAPGTLFVATVNTTTGALSSIGTPMTGVGAAEGWNVTDPH
jgi:6-phosphogluconolactonase